jgi:hypothetical protein
MVSDRWHLPNSPELDIAALSRIFDKVTNSYKYLFFLSLLDILQRRQFDVEAPITFREIIIEILANAWYPHTYFQLSFGTQDQITSSLDALNLPSSQAVIPFNDRDKEQLRQIISTCNLDQIVKRLTRFVPFRLLSPFLDSEIKAEKIDKGKGTKLEYAIPAIAANLFYTQKPPYCFGSSEHTQVKAWEYKDCISLIVHPAWGGYLESNYTIVKSWASWHWLDYMKQKNPHIFAIANKIFTSQERAFLPD